MNVNIKALEEALKSYVLHPENAIAKLAVQINAQNVDMETLMVMIKRKTMQMVENQEKDFFQQITTLLDISVALVDKSAVEPNFVFVLIEDLLDVLTINYTELLFDYLESRVEKLVKDMLPNDRKALALLRSCNQLCRRLSKTKNTLALGRIKLFLSSVFPICEKSGVNRKGDFNTENITTLDTEASECKEEYTSMWDLQKYFSNPVLLYQNSCYRDMQNKVDFVLSYFEKLKDPEFSPKRKYREDLLLLSKPDHFFPKYLTSPDVFELQLNDPFFRRQFLIQFLYISHFLVQTLMQKNVAANKSVQFTINISQTQEEWINDSRIKAKGILEKIGPLGTNFSKTVWTTINYEQSWCEWKANSCQNYERKPLKKLALKPTKTPKASLAANPLFMGNQDMTKLWSNGTNIIDGLCKNEQSGRKYIKPLGKVLEQLDEQVAEDLQTPLDDIEEEYLLYHQMSFNWLAFRVAVEADMDMFVGSDFDNTTPGRTLLKVWRDSKNLSSKKSDQLVFLKKRVKDEKREHDDHADDIEGIPKKVRIE